MKTDSHVKCLHRLAVPYYGRLITPRIGLSPIYFVADVDSHGAKVHCFEVLVWDLRQEPRLAAWLRKQGVNGVLCSDPHPPLQEELAQEGVWVRANEAGEAMDMLERWACRASDLAFLNECTQPWEDRVPGCSIFQGP